MCFCYRRGFFSIPLSIMFFMMNSNCPQPDAIESFLRTKKKVRKVTLTNIPCLSLGWAWVMQFGTNKVIYSPTFLNIYWGMVNHDKIIIHMQILWADSSSHNDCCFPTCYHIILQQVVKQHLKKFPLKHKWAHSRHSVGYLRQVHILLTIWIS